MRRLLLLRHAKTERAEPGERDRDRKLMARGRADAPVIGAYMARHRLAPDFVLVSPVTRAEETWALVAAALGKPPRLARDARIYNASPQTLIEVIGETRDARALLVVGHNPGLHDLAVQLIASGDVEARERINEKTADVRAGGDRVSVRRLVATASQFRQAGALRQSAPDRRGDRLTRLTSGARAGCI
jgi:phosphohistidine phosphatase